MRVPPVLVAGREVVFRSYYDTKLGTISAGNVTYTWNFGDGRSNSTRNRIISHSFSLPGNYSIELMTSNPFSNRTAAMDVNVLGKSPSPSLSLSLLSPLSLPYPSPWFADTVVGVMIVPPLQLKESKVPASLQLVFSAVISTQYNTSLTGSLTYSWDLGDGSNSSASGRIISHTYTSNGTFVVSCSVQQHGLVVLAKATLSLQVFEG